MRRNTIACKGGRGGGPGSNSPRPQGFARAHGAIPQSWLVRFSHCNATKRVASAAVGPPWLGPAAGAGQGEAEPAPASRQQRRARGSGPGARPGGTQQRGPWAQPATARARPAGRSLPLPRAAVSSWLCALALPLVAAVPDGRHGQQLVCATQGVAASCAKPRPRPTSCRDEGDSAGSLQAGSCHAGAAADVRF